MKKKALGIALLLIGIICILFGLHQVYATSRYGSTGTEVTEIQQKLKDWGYYDGDVDGIFGSKTLQAVKDFQEANNLTVDRNSW